MQKNYLKFVITSLLVLLLSGCGGGDTTPTDNQNSQNAEVDTTPLPTINLSGKAVDSHALSGSTVCLDLSGDNACQEDIEPTTTTDTDGTYRLNITEAHQKNAGYSTAKIVLSGGQDVTTGVEFIGTLSTLFDSSIRDNILLTPLSTLVALLKEKNNLARAEAERQVALSFGLEVSQLSKDPLEELKIGKKAIFEANLKIQQSAQLIESQDNLKKMEDIYNAFTENIANQKEFTDGLGSEEKIKILQDFIDEELAKLKSDALAQLNNDMRALIAVTQSVDRVEVGLRNETNTTDFNTTQYVVSADSLGDEYIDGVYIDGTPSDINIVDLLAGKTVYRVFQHIIESSSFNADMTVMTWENVYGEGQEGQELGNKGTVPISVVDNKVIVGGSDTFWIIEDNVDYIVVTNGTDTQKSYKDLEKAKAYYESMNSGSEPTDLSSGTYIQDNNTINIDGASLNMNSSNPPILQFNLKYYTSDGKDMVQINTIYTSKEEFDNKFSNNSLIIDSNNGSVGMEIAGQGWVGNDSVSSDFQVEVIKNSDGTYNLTSKGHFISSGRTIKDINVINILSKEEGNTADVPTPTTTDFQSEISGKTFYHIDNELIKEIKFNADVTTLTVTTVVGSDTDGNGVLPAKFENNKIVLLEEYNKYMTFNQKTIDYLVLDFYSPDGIKEDEGKFYFDLAKAEADLASAITPETPAVAEDNSLSFNINSSQAIIAYDTPFSDIPAPSARRARVVGTTETVSNLLAIDETGVAKSAINSNYPVKVKYTVTSPDGASLFVVLDPFYTDTTGYDYSTVVALNNCAIYEVNVTSNSSVCVKEGVTVQDMDIEYIKMVGNKKPIQFDDNGSAYFLATAFGVENNTTTHSAEKARLYMYANNSASVISQDNEEVHFFNTVPNGEVVYYKTVTSSTETATSLYIRHLDGSVARLTPDNINYFTLDSSDVVAYSDTTTNGIKLLRSLDGDKVQKTILDTTRYEGKSQNTLFADDGNLYSVFESVNSTTGMNQVKLYQVLPYDPNPKVVIDLGTDDYHSYSKTPIQVSKGYVYYSKVQEIFDTNGVSMGNASIIYIVRLSTGDSYELLNPNDNSGNRIQLYNWRLSEKQLYFAGLNESTNVVVTGEIDVNEVTRNANPTGATTIHDSISQSAQLADAKVNDIEIVLPTIPPLDPGHNPQLINGIELTPTNLHSASMEFNKYMNKASVEKELTYTSGGTDVRYMPLWIYKTLHLVPDLDGVPGDEHTTSMIENSEYTIALSNKALDLYDWEFDGATKTITIVVDNDGDGFLSDTDPDDNDTCSPSLDVGSCDQDNDWLTNDEEINTFNTDPQNPDTDGDGLLDGRDEVLSSTTSNPLDSCDPTQSLGYRGYDNNNSIWQQADCDGDGYLNGAEDNISLAPNNYISDPYDSSDRGFTFNEKIYYEVTTSDGRVWLDRNLGATKVCETSVDTDCYGDLYQWGRGTDGHEDRNSTAIDVNPDYFPYISIYHEISTTGNFDWLSISGGNEQTTGFVAERKASWSSISNNIVCPLGFYVPTKAELTTLANAEGIVDSATAFSSALKLALSGSRLNDSSIEMANVEGYIWTTDVDVNTNTSYAFTYSNTNTLWSRAYRATGYSVRCIKAQ